jgi:hypothetical protein
MSENTAASTAATINMNHKRQCAVHAQVQHTRRDVMKGEQSSVEKNI